MENISNLSAIYRWLTIWGITTLRYLLIAAPPYLLFYIMIRSRVESHRIQPDGKSKTRVKEEIFYSILSLLILAAFPALVIQLAQSGIGTIYRDLNQYGAPYLLFSFVLLLLLHDTYFYFGHRLMHTKILYHRTHSLHHRFVNPTPFASFAFQPAEALIHGLFGLIIAMTIPVHQGVFFLFIIVSNLMNVAGHLGFEIFSRGYAGGPRGWIMNTPTHHNMHHRYNRCNYGLYFNFWDRIMGTNHPDYFHKFDEVAPVYGSSHQSVEKLE